MRRVFLPRRASTTARLIAVVVFPTPPFWLTTARTWPTLLAGVFGYRFARYGFAVANRLQRRRGVTNPTLGFCSGRRLGEKCFEVFGGAVTIAAFEQQERETVV